MNKAPKFLFTKSKLKALVMLLLISFSFVIITPKPVHAQTDFNQAINNILTPIWEFLKKAYEKGGAAAFQTTVRTALNKIAYDTANWIGSGAQGQKPLFVTQGWGDYLAQVGDEAAGQFLEQAVSNWQSANWSSDAKGSALNEQCTLSYNNCLKCETCSTSGPPSPQCLETCEKNCETAYISCAGVTTTNDGVTAARGGISPARSVCRPSSIEARLQIAMGLVDNQRPQAPNCSASELVENWDNYYQKLTNFRDPSFLNKFANIFNPVSNDLGIYMTLRANSQEVVDVKATDAERSLIADGGWLNMRDIAGNLTGLPGDAARKTELAEQSYINNMAEFSGDALIDAANVFLNQLALSSFNRLMSGLGKTVTNNSSANLSNPSSDPNIRYGEGTVRESAASIIEPDFTTRADYDILVSLSMCRDRNNPGPTECVIDDRLMQGITEKQTVAEAVKAGYLRREWQFTSEYREGSYNLRNLQIMRKYRIVPIGWEVAAQMNKKATLIDLMSCFSGSDEYNEYSSGFDVRNQSWCRGLVDPNWVLKAPLNYCAKQGYGAQILSVNIIPSTGLNGQMKDEVQMLRADNYCADDQTCINENSDGSCEAYGYCLSERRTWNFNSPSCEPIDNTCSSFVNSNSGVKVAYLENTLDYGDCTADSIGCQRYSTNGSYNLTQGQVTWSANPFSNAYFNSKLTDCSSSSESCSEMMRVKPGWGSNLVMGADFAQDNIGDTANGGRINNYWNIWSDASFEAEIIDTATLDGISLGKAIQASSNGNVVGVYSNNAVSLIPSNLNVLSGETYTLSADVYLVAGEKVHAVLGDDYEKFVETRDQEVWRHLSVTRSLKEQPLSELAFQIVAYNENGPVDFALRNIKLEMNSYDSGFSLYGAYKVYQKLIPNYLYDVCYVDATSSSPDYRLKENAPAICNNFARQCNLEEAGCERFTEAASGFSVAAKAVTTDYCDASCNNYDIYVTRASYFYAPQIEKIIPQNSETCNAQAVGCSEFTNLDVAAAGGEGREYYTQLKQCIKPGADCADFYSWVGTEESGYQLKSYVLKKDNSGNPATTFDNTDLCNESIFNLPSNHPSFNPDCRQYYNKAGQISYRLTASTITCSENCHTYRLSENNVDTTVAQADCNGSDRFWNINNSACYVCQNGGTWSNQYQACLYQAIPNEGIKCSASQNGCREYNGSSGNNTRLIAAHSFDNDLEGFEGQCGDAAVYSNVANSNNGKSLMYDRGANAGGAQQTTNCDQNAVTWLDKLIGTAQAAPTSFVRKIVGKTVSQGKAYSLKFTASAASDTSVYFAFLNSNDDIAYFNASSNNATGNITISGNGEWKTYELNLNNLDHIVDNKEALVVVANKDFYLDNLVLTEITNRYYLIKNTSKIPDVCYYDMLDNYQGVDYNLGCSLYTDRFNNSHYLRQFSQLCQDSAVGCELMVDTANYDNFKGNIWKDLNDNGVCDASEPECMKVEGDRFFYAIYDESKLCNSADLGCSRLGLSSNSGQNLAWSDVFKRNNPNQYDQILCNASEAGCEAWQYSDGRGTAYFKNPGNDVCVYRNSTNPENMVKAWYKAPVMRCDLNESGVIDANEIGTKICASSNDCAANRPCILDNNDYECPVSYLETFGTGGGGKQVPVPSDSAAICTAAASGCTEYIDPISSFATNLVKDPNYDDNSNAWINGRQKVNVEPNSLYIFSVETDNSSLSNNVRLEPEIGVLLLEEDNNLGSELQTELIIPSGEPEKRFIFHSRNNTKLTVFGPNVNHEIILKKAIIDYQLQQNIDKSSCNGLVNTNNGCILFNERSVNGAQGLLPLSGAWNAAASSNGQAPQLCSSGNCDANTLIKVRPDRTCASWLDCVTYVLDPETNERTCYALGECNALNEQGECINFIEPSANLLTEENLDLSKHTGYSILDQYSLARMKEVGLNTTAHYDFEDSSPTLYCSRTNSDDECIVDNSLQADYIVNSPSNAPTDYPAEGSSYLKVMAGQMIAPHSINAPISVKANTDYYLNFLVNTKNSGTQAKVLVYKYDSDNSYWNNTPLATSPQRFSSNEGWTRQVLKFNTGNATNTVIYLSSDANQIEERYVYFDDINIEPVLEVGENEYIAKECRLYPNQNAISCSSINNQVVQDGLVGYCLQHDPANKNVCLLWYPIDAINASMTSGRSALGYQGAFPLNYCTEANGNFELAEKRKAFFLKSDDTNGECNPNNYPRNGFNYNDWNCPTDYVLYYREYNHRGNNENRSDCNGDYWCVPRTDLGTIVYQWRHEASGCQWDNIYNLTETQNTTSNKALLITNDAEPLYAADYSGQQCGYQARIISMSDGWYTYNGFQLEESKNADPAIRIYDVNYPTTDEDQLKLISSSDPEKVYYPTCNRFAQVVDNDGNNQAWVDRVSKASAYPYQTPLFFRDANNEYGPSALCYIIEEQCIEECACDNQCECWQTGENCMHPCDYVGECLLYDDVQVIVDCSTPGAIQGLFNEDAFNFTAYGRNRELVPFGGATFPEGFNIFSSEAVKLRNQYSNKIDQKVFAGRPYGCEGPGCNNIGYCSLNPNVYCILDDTDSANVSLVNQKSCGSANGTCVPMWNGDAVSSTINFHSENILKNMFLTAYDGYAFDLSRGTYVGASAYDIGVGGSFVGSLGSSCVNCHTVNYDANFSSYWKYVLPVVKNVKLNDVGTIGVVAVENPGIYTLTFNTVIDKEQQPLRDLLIDWGDDNFQNLVNQDYRPDLNQPHTVYHYYKEAGVYNIEIKITDNWGFYRNWP